MGKKKGSRVKNSTAYIACEGDRENLFCEFLDELYEPKKNKINLNYENLHGGRADKFVKQAIIEINRDKSFAWFDEDFESIADQRLSNDQKRKLIEAWKIPSDKEAEFLKTESKDLQGKFNQNKRKPILIVSQPICVEAMIIRILGKELPEKAKIFDPRNREKQIEMLKNAVDGIMGLSGSKKEKETQAKEYYRANLTKEILEEKRKEIKELDLLLLAFVK